VPPFDPVPIPHDIEKRGVATGTDQELNPQFSDPLPPSAAKIGLGHPLKVQVERRQRGGCPTDLGSRYRAG
jgi:hypothetical protein